MSQTSLAERVRRSMPEEKVKILRDMPGTEKMSKVIKDFAAPWLDLARTEEEKVIGLAILAWNRARLPEGERTQRLSKDLPGVRGDAGMDMPRSVIKHKLALFSHLNRIILDYEIADSGHGHQLNVVSTVSDTEKHLKQAKPRSVAVKARRKNLRLRKNEITCAPYTTAG